MSKPKTPGAQLRADVLKVYGKLGGPEYLRQLAELDPKLFSQFLLKMIPSESAVTGADGGPVSINVVTGVARSPEDPLEEVDRDDEDKSTE